MDLLDSTTRGAPPELPRFLTTAEVAEIVRVTPSTVRYWRHRGTGPDGERVGKKVLYPREAVDAWLSAKFAGATRQVAA